MPQVGVMSSGAVPATAVALLDLDQDELDFPVYAVTRDQSRVRVLVRTNARPLGFLDLPLTDGRIDRAKLLALAVALRDRAAAAGRAVQPLTLAPIGPVSVVVCTRDRSDSLVRCLQALLSQAETHTQIVVVDNAPSSQATAEVVRRLADTRIRYVYEPRPGLSIARNTGVAASDHELIAFTDDDVVADSLWLRALSSAVRMGDAECLTGAVPSGELNTQAQHYFERRVNWTSGFEPALFGQDDDRGPLYPFSPGIFGTGANFALSRSLYDRVGPFDERLGAGRLTRGGEDLDYFTRVILGGGAIRYEPAALVWHVHRPELEAFREQMFGYGVGFGAYATKLLSSTQTRGAFLRRVPWGVAGIRQAHQLVEREGLPAEFTRVERRGFLAGPFAYLRERRRATGNDPERRHQWTRQETANP